MTGDELMQAMETARDAVAALTGMRQQFIEAGWSPENAELMVVEILRASNRQVTQ